MSFHDPRFLLARSRRGRDRRRRRAGPLHDPALRRPDLKHVRLGELVEASAAVTATPARNEKVAVLAGLLARAEADEVAPLVSWLSGELTQRQIGVGWALLRERPTPAAEASMTVAELERAL